jgi:hypothetical protein
MKTFSDTTRKNIFVFFVGPLVMLPAVLLGALVLSLFAGGEDLLSALGFGLFVASIGLVVFAYPATLVIGIPAIIILERKNKYGLMPLVLIGLLGAGFITVLSAPSVFVLAAYSYSAISVSLGCWYANRWYSARL